MALWKARGGSVNKELGFRSWHCGKQERRHFQSKTNFTGGASENVVRCK